MTKREFLVLTPADVASRLSTNKLVCVLVDPYFYRYCPVSTPLLLGTRNSCVNTGEHHQTQQRVHRPCPGKGRVVQSERRRFSPSSAAAGLHCSPARVRLDRFGRVPQPPLGPNAHEHNARCKETFCTLECPRARRLSPTGKNQWKRKHTPPRVGQRHSFPSPASPPPDIDVGRTPSTQQRTLPGQPAPIFSPCRPSRCLPPRRSGNPRSQTLVR